MATDNNASTVNYKGVSRGIYIKSENGNSTVLASAPDKYAIQNNTSIKPYDQLGLYNYTVSENANRGEEYSAQYIMSQEYAIQEGMRSDEEIKEKELEEDSIDSPSGSSSSGSHGFDSSDATSTTSSNGTSSDSSTFTIEGYIDKLVNDRKDSLNSKLYDDQFNISNYINRNKTSTTVTYGERFNQYQQDLISKMMSDQMRGVEAIPYQFLPSVDSRLGETSINVVDESRIGRKYAEKIMSRMPLLFLTPCAPMALTDFSKEDRANILERLVVGEGQDKDDLINGSGRYYSARFDFANYYRYLNCMLASVVSFMGLYDEEIIIGEGEKAKLGSYDWSKEMPESLKSFFSSKENVVFYLDGLNSISESFSNSTTESAIASTVNEASSIGQELKFLLGGSNEFTQSLSTMAGNAASTIANGITSILGNITGESTMLKLVDTGVNALVSGGKIIFPKIWSQSDYSRSYSLSIKLRSPDHDPLSIFLNILKPYCKLLCLTLPKVYRSAGTLYDNNAYNSPFLVKAYCKGMFNIDMGLITSLSVEKGTECQWTDDGLPTQVDITVEIEDLYSVLAMSGFEHSGGLFNLGNPFTASKIITNIVNNTAYMDFLANMAGMNIAQEEIGRRAKMYTYLARTAISQYPSRKFMELEQGISRFKRTLYESW